jgi:hypothetical protein
MKEIQVILISQSMYSTRVGAELKNPIPKCNYMEGVAIVVEL